MKQHPNSLKNLTPFKKGNKASVGYGRPRLWKDRSTSDDTFTKKKYFYTLALMFIAIATFTFLCFIPIIKKELDVNRSYASIACIEEGPGASVYFKSDRIIRLTFIGKNTIVSSKATIYFIKWNEDALGRAVVIEDPNVVRGFYTGEYKMPFGCIEENELWKNRK